MNMLVVEYLAVSEYECQYEHKAMSLSYCVQSHEN